MKHRDKTISNKGGLTFLLGLYLCNTAAIDPPALNWTATSGKAPSRVSTILHPFQHGNNDDPYTCVRARLGDSAGSIPATCIAGYLFATDKVHVKQTDLCVRANNVSYDRLSMTSIFNISGCYPVHRPLTLKLTLKMTLNIKTKVIFVSQRPKLDI